MNDTTVRSAIATRLTQLQGSAECLAEGIHIQLVALSRGIPKVFRQGDLEAWLQMLDSLSARLEPPEGILGERPEPWRLRKTIERALVRARARSKGGRTPGGRGGKTC